jgi:transposase
MPVFAKVVGLDVARRYDVNANQVFGWRKLYGDDRRPPAGRSVPQLIPVTITAEQDGAAAQPSMVAGHIEIQVAGRYRICVDSGSNAQGLRRVLDVLERR